MQPTAWQASFRSSARVRSLQGLQIGIHLNRSACQQSNREYPATKWQVITAFKKYMDVCCITLVLQMFKTRCPDFFILFSLESILVFTEKMHRRKPRNGYARIITGAWSLWSCSKIHTASISTPERSAVCLYLLFTQKQYWAELFLLEVAHSQHLSSFYSTPILNKVSWLPNPFPTCATSVHHRARKLYASSAQQAIRPVSHTHIPCGTAIFPNQIISDIESTLCVQVRCLMGFTSNLWGYCLVSKPGTVFNTLLEVNP